MRYFSVTRKPRAKLRVAPTSLLDFGAFARLYCLKGFRKMSLRKNNVKCKERNDQCETLFEFRDKRSEFGEHRAVT